MDNYVKDFKKNGYVIKSIFSDSELGDLQKTLYEIIKMQSTKINLKSNKNLINSIRSLQKKYPLALDECFLMLRNSSIGHSMAGNKKLLGFSKKIIDLNDSPIIISGPSIFLNIPSTNTRKYTYHSEKNWYPKRRNFVNVWFPLLNDRIDNNSMKILPGSHKKDWIHFSEYTGYDGKFGIEENVQYEIPKSFLKDFKSIIPKIKYNEAIFFHGNLIHRSLNCDEMQLAMVFRIFNYSKDLTLSSNWADIPYNRQSLGYPEINV